MLDLQARLIRLPLRYLAAFIAVVLLLSSGSPLLAQTQDPTTKTLHDLEASVRDLGKQITELTTLLRAVLPPTPIEDVAPFELSVTRSVTKGSLTAKIALIEFSDFQCPFCGRHFQTVYPELQRQYIENGKAIYVFRNLPLSALHPQAMKAAEAGECAREQGKFWEMHDRLFTNQNAIAAADLIRSSESLGLDADAFKECLENGKATSIIQRDLDEAQRLNLTGTPAFFLGDLKPDGTVHVTKRILGAQPLQVFQSAFESILNDTEGDTRR